MIAITAWSSPRNSAHPKPQCFIEPHRDGAADGPISAVVGLPGRAECHQRGRGGAERGKNVRVEAGPIAWD
jgi:hypothetical protein